MNKTIGWLFLLIALVTLLPLIGIAQLGDAGTWIVVIATAVIGYMIVQGTK